MSLGLTLSLIAASLSALRADQAREPPKDIPLTKLAMYGRVT